MMKYITFVLVIVIIVLSYLLATNDKNNTAHEPAPQVRENASRSTTELNIQTEKTVESTTKSATSRENGPVTTSQTTTISKPSTTQKTFNTYKNNTYNVTFNYPTQSTITENFDYKNRKAFMVSIQASQDPRPIIVTDYISTVPRMMKATSSKKRINNIEVTYTEYRNAESDVQPAYIGYDYRLGDLSVEVTVILRAGVSNGIAATNDQAVSDAEMIIASLVKN